MINLFRFVVIRTKNIEKDMFEDLQDTYGFSKITITKEINTILKCKFRIKYCKSKKLVYNKF